MAGDFIKIEHATPDKPEIMLIAESLHITENEVLGGLVRFWIWCDCQSRDGHAIGVTEKGLERISGVTGLFQAMVSAGWLDVSTGQVDVPHYDYHLSQNAKTRALANRRQARKRHADVTPMSRDMRDENVTREEKRREEKSNTPKAPKGAVEYSPDFARFWLAFPPGRKTAKGAAWTAWRAAIKSTDPEVVILAATEYAASPVGRGEFVKGPAPWLRGRCWEDDRAAWQRRDQNGKGGGAVAAMEEYIRLEGLDDDEEESRTVDGVVRGVQSGADANGDQGLRTRVADLE